MEDRARTIDPSHPGLFVHFRSEFPAPRQRRRSLPAALRQADDDMNRSTDSGPSAVTLSDDEESARTLSESGAWRVPFPALGSSRQEELGQAIFADRAATEGSARRERVRISKYTSRRAEIASASRLAYPTGWLKRTGHSKAGQR